MRRQRGKEWKESDVNEKVCRPGKKKNEKKNVKV